MDNSGPEYRCDACGGEFERGWSDDEAVAELEATFPATTKESCAIICDDCYKKIMGEIFQ